MTDKKKTPYKKEQDQWLEKASILTETLPYMRQHAGKTVVVKFGGHAMGDPNLFSLFADDIVLLKQVGINPIVVHGGGPQIARMLERLRVQSSYVEGLRITDAETVDIVEMVLSGSINKEIVTAINAAGGRAVGLSGKDGNLIRAKRLTRTVKDETSQIEKVLDLGFVGEPDRVNPHILKEFSDSDIIPVIAPIGFGENNETYNINADMAAGAVASALGASRLLMLTDVPGVLDTDKALIHQLPTDMALDMIDSGAISGGMIPKVNTCMKAVKGGVQAAVILDGRVPHSCLLEMFTPHGAGTMIRRG